MPLYTELTERITKLEAENKRLRQNKYQLADDAWLEWCRMAHIWDGSFFDYVMTEYPKWLNRRLNENLQQPKAKGSGC